MLNREATQRDLDERYHHLLKLAGDICDAMGTLPAGQRQQGQLHDAILLHALPPLDEAVEGYLAVAEQYMACSGRGDWHGLIAYILSHSEHLEHDPHEIVAGRIAHALMPRGVELPIRPTVADTEGSS